MQLAKEQLDELEENGYILLPGLFSKSEIDLIRTELPGIFAEVSPKRVLEEGGELIRSVYGCHTTNDIVRDLTQLPRVVEPAMQILDSKVYVYQSKINAKAAFGGDVWQWHQDFIFWRNEDGMPMPRVINVAIFLDEANEFNGPMLVIPGSHKEGIVETLAKDLFSQDGSERASVYKDKPKWISNLTANLKYSLDKETIKSLANKYGIVSLKGPAGSVLFFHSNLVHASTHNISPFDRAVIMISFNSVENIPVPVKNPRPGFLSSTDTMPLVAISDDALLMRSLAAQSTRN